MDQLERYKVQFDRLIASLDGADSVSHRTASFEKFLNIGIPNKKMEDWKYSDVSALSKELEPQNHFRDNEEFELPDKTTGWPRLVYLNGTFSEIHSDTTSINGIELSKKETPSQSNQNEPLSFLNKALSVGGNHLQVSPKAEVEEIEILNIFSGNQSQVIHIENNIYLEEGVNLSIFTKNICLNNMGWINMSSNVSVPKNSSLIQINELRTSTDSFFSFEENIHLNGGQYENHSLLMDTGAARHLINIDVQKENSNALLNGAFLANNNETLDTLTRLNHLVPNSNSEQFYRGVLKKGGKTAFQGRVLVNPDSQNTIANQSCKNLMLDRDSEANVKPELLIYADDVKCAHGATVGELDPEAYFYLLQRGIEPELAHGLLVNAFLGEIIEGIPAESIKNYFSQLVSDWMNND